MDSTEVPYGCLEDFHSPLQLSYGPYQVPYEYLVGSSWSIVGQNGSLQGPYGPLQVYSSAGLSWTRAQPL